jgi:hypothetical protein
LVTSQRQAPTFIPALMASITVLFRAVAHSFRMLSAL